MDTTVQPTIGEVPDAVWTMIEPILKACYPATPKGHGRVDLRWVPTASSSGCALVVNGTNCRGAVVTTVPCIATASSAANAAFWHTSGPLLVETCDELAGWTGGGRLPTPPWAKPACGVIWEVASPQTGGTSGETPPGGGSRWRTARRGHCWGQRPRYHALGRHACEHPRGAPPADAAALP